MAQRSEKTYISVQEFIASWEKEVYELTGLDYFTFLLINDLGYHIEHDFFHDQDHPSHLRIEAEDIATLAFNIGDSFETFLENNCLSDCSLSCPTRLNERIDPEEVDQNDTRMHILQLVNGSDTNKKQILLNDILNYVVLDTLYDFYNYEIGLNLDDADMGLMRLADFISGLMEKFIESKGQQYLNNPKESAADQFSNQMRDAESDWDVSFEDEEEEKKRWPDP